MQQTRVLRAEFRSSLSLLEDRIIMVGRRVQHAIGLSLRGLQGGSPEICRQVLAADDEVDLEVHQAEAEIAQMLTLQGPVADDMRLLLSLQRVSGSIERIGDGAVNIARLGAELAGVDGGTPQLAAQVGELGRRAERAVREGLDAFGQRRLESDRVVTVEDQIDLLHDGLTARLIAHAASGGDATEWAVRMVLASRHLERMGDHAVKIAGEGVFVVTGRRPLPRSLR